MNIDPLLKQLLADTAAAGESIPLEVYLPSGKLYGNTTSHEDFCRWATVQLGQESGYTGTVAPAPDPEYAHLVVSRMTVVPGEREVTEVVRVRLADVVAWTVG